LDSSFQKSFHNSNPISLALITCVFADRTAPGLADRVGVAVAAFLWEGRMTLVVDRLHVCSRHNLLMAGINATFFKA
jgi:hypothetical protein